MFIQNGKSIAEILIRKSLPSVGSPSFGELGGLLGYGADGIEMHRRAAIYIDKILKATKAGDLPIEQSTRFEFVVNLKTAVALGIKLRPEIMVRATRVIQ